MTRRVTPALRPALALLGLLLLAAPAVLLAPQPAGAAWTATATGVTAGGQNTALDVGTPTATRAGGLLGCLLSTATYTITWPYSGPTTGVTFTVTRTQGGVTTPVGSGLSALVRTLSDLTTVVLFEGLSYTVTARAGTAWTDTATVTVC